MLTKDLERILNSYEFYYDVIKENAEKPFDAEAVFHSHDEQYFLTRKAQISEMDSHEFVYFIQLENLTLPELKQLINTAWERGLTQVKPSSTHRNSDVVLIILTKNIAENTLDYIQKVKLTKNYKLSFHGWSSFQLIVKDLSTNKLYFNKLARKHKEMYRKIFNGGES